MAEGASLQIVVASEEETRALGVALGRALPASAVISLSGELGAGKTTLTRGIAEGLDVRDLRRVNSPTYVLEQIYPGRVPIHHYDAYRLGSPEELLALGFEEHLGDDGVLIVEWGDRVETLLPAETLWVELCHASGSTENPARGTTRQVHLEGAAPLWQEVLRRLESFRE